MDQNAFRNAFAAGEFAKARRLWDEYAEELRRAIASGRARQGELDDAAKLLEWARCSAAAYQAQSAAQLGEARAAARYARGDAGERVKVRAVI